ncbi:hypothetical protein Hanom_Chr09g00858361 [Helianthus anomalus]
MFLVPKFPHQDFGQQMATLLHIFFAFSCLSSCRHTIAAYIFIIQYSLFTEDENCTWKMLKKSPL